MLNNARSTASSSRQGSPHGTPHGTPHGSVRSFAGPPPHPSGPPLAISIQRNNSVTSISSNSSQSSHPSPTRTVPPPTELRRPRFNSNSDSSGLSEFVVKEGWLEKKSADKSWKTGWKKRWAVLTNRHFVLMRKTGTIKKPEFKFPLDAYVSAEQLWEEIHHRKHCFILRGPEIISLCANNAEECSEWVSAMKSALAHKGDQHGETHDDSYAHMPEKELRNLLKLYDIEEKKEMDAVRQRYLIQIGEVYRRLRELEAKGVRINT